MFEVMEKKLKFLNNFKINPAALSISNQIRTRMSSLSQFPNAPSIADSACLWSLYCVFKNLKWHRTQLFKEIFIENLSTESCLSFSVCEQIFNDIAANLGKTDNEFLFNSEEFMKYIFCWSYIANDLDEIYLELGFRGSILEKIRSRLYEESGRSLFLDTPNRWDKSISDTIEYFDKKQSRNVASVETELIRIWFNGREEFLSDNAIVENLFLILLHIGKFDSCSKKDLERFVKNLEWNNAPEKFRDASFLIETLISLKLVLAAEQSSRKKSHKLKLTKLAERCTRRAFAKDFLQSRTAASVSQLCPSYQKAVIEMCDDSRFSGILEEVGNFSPLGVKEVIDRLLRSKSDDSIAAINGILLKTKSSWQKSSICEKLGEWGEADQIRQILKKLALSDESELVKSTALSQLVSIEHKHPRTHC